MDKAIKAALAKFAKQDLALARKEGLISVCQTKLGTLDLAFDSATKTYTLKTCGIESRVLASGRAGVVADALANAYDVVVE